MVNCVEDVIVNPATPLFSTPFHPAHYFQPYLVYRLTRLILCRKSYPNLGSEINL